MTFPPTDWAMIRRRSYALRFFLETISKIRNSSNSSNISVVLKLFTDSVVSYIQRILVANPRELLKTVANPARGLLNPEHGDTTVVLE